MPYGHTILGSLFFDENNADGCDRYGSQVYEGHRKSLIFFVYRGGCRFSDKTRNAQFAGAHMLVIVDTDEFDNLEQLIMQGDGSDLEIPTVMIDSIQGKGIVDYYLEHDADI